MSNHLERFNKEAQFTFVPETYVATHAIDDGKFETIINAHEGFRMAFLRVFLQANPHTDIQQLRALVENRFNQLMVTRKQPVPEPDIRNLAKRNYNTRIALGGTYEHASDEQGDWFSAEAELGQGEVVAGMVYQLNPPFVEKMTVGSDYYAGQVMVPYMLYHALQIEKGRKLRDNPKIKFYPTALDSHLSEEATKGFFGINS